MYSQDQHTTAAALQAIAQPVSMTAAPFTLAALETGTEGRPGSVARRVRASLRVVKAWAGFTLKRSPKWARALAVACLAIPGPVDEVIVWPALAVYVAVRNWADFTTVIGQAWRGVAR